MKMSLGFGRSYHRVIFGTCPPASSCVRAGPVRRSRQVMRHRRSCAVFSLSLVPGCRFRAVVVSCTSGYRVLRPRSLGGDLMNQTGGVVGCGTSVWFPRAVGRIYGIGECFYVVGGWGMLV